MKKIILIGSGSVATNLALNLDKNKYSVQQVFSRTKENAEILAKKINADFTNDINKLQKGDITLLCIKDDFIASFLEGKLFQNLIHTSGSANINVLKNSAQDFGVLYPLQTFNKEVKINFTEIPILIEASTVKFKKVVLELASSLSNKVINITSKKRRQIHIAAVFACNFSHHMLSISKEIMDNEDLDYSLLLPLIEENNKKSLLGDPKKLQTGPAKRNDVKLINEHIKEIKNLHHKEIYRLLSDNIIKINGK